MVRPVTLHHQGHIESVADFFHVAPAVLSSSAVNHLLAPSVKSGRLPANLIMSQNKHGTY